MRRAQVLDPRARRGERVERDIDAVEIAVVGKYMDLHDAYKSIYEALSHGGIHHQLAVDLRKVRALQPIAQRNYDYDRYWVVFPLKTESGAPLFGPGDTTAELLVRIYNREGAVSWPIRADVRARLAPR